MITESTITCPVCSTARLESMPTDACQYFYECTGCGTLYSAPTARTPCPPIQTADGSPLCCQGEEGRVTAELDGRLPEGRRGSHQTYHGWQPAQGRAGEQSDVSGVSSLHVAAIVARSQVTYSGSTQAVPARWGRFCSTGQLCQLPSRQTALSLWPLRLRPEHQRFIKRKPGPSPFSAMNWMSTAIGSRGRGMRS